MKQQDMLSLFQLAGIEVLNSWKLVNGYVGDSADYIKHATPLPQFFDDRNPAVMTIGHLDFLSHAVQALGDPWWLAKTPVGLIVIGWRKRVISIDWSDTAIDVVVTTDDVTKDGKSVHAYTFAKAVEYLTNLSEHIKADASLKAALKE